MPQEIIEADESERRTGVRQVTVAGRVFAVLPIEEGEQAAAEARGETYKAATSPNGNRAQSNRSPVHIEEHGTIEVRLPSPPQPLAPPAPDAELGELPVDGELEHGSDGESFPPDVLVDDDAESVAMVEASATPPSPERREQWPLLEHLLPATDPDSLRRRSEVTASSYLSRQTPRADRT